MELGSLHDLLHNESMVIEGEIILPVLRDIARGIRFLHAATPTICHSDLKSGNVLVDSKFRAKVAVSFFCSVIFDELVLLSYPDLAFGFCSGFWLFAKEVLSSERGRHTVLDGS